MPPEENGKPSQGPRSLIVSPRLTDKDFAEIRTLVKAKTGINLGLHKRDLVVSRLARRLRALNLGSFRQYIQLLQDSGDDGELVNMINQITTNKTEFYRENHHFEFLRDKVLPQILENGERSGQRLVRAWSAGCSSGEEPYSLALTLGEFFRNRSGWDVKLLATDLDTNMLLRASQGEYDEATVEPVPRPLLSRYFTRARRAEGTFYKVGPEIRSMITFRKFNLMNPTYPLKVNLDFIFCRNVLIYFESTDKLEILKKFHGVLKPAAPLFVGHSESLMMAKDLFQYLATTVYRKV
ncbi:MAG: protein-glutamate O-methyltransferase CheR [Deltaproteobacteria bacterium]|nr:protein-glutamate O-methyltransferase CheR [Deltaproteobacteria bacterium]